MAREAVEKASGEHFAVKMVSKARFDRLSDKKNYFNMMRQEIEIMKKLEHTNIIKLKEVHIHTYTHTHCHSISFPYRFLKMTSTSTW